MSRQRVYSLRTRQNAVKLAKEMEENGLCICKGKEVRSLRKLAELLDLKNESTLRYWMKIGDWSNSATKIRLCKRGIESKLDEEQQKKIENYVLDCERTYVHCGIDEVCSFCEKEFNWKPSSSWVSSFLKTRETPIRSHVVQKRPAKRNRDSAEEEIKNFREELDDLRMKRSKGRVWHMDETGLWNDSIHKKSYSRIGVSPMELTTDNHGRDTVVLTCSEDGKKLDSFYIQHRRKKFKTTKSITGKKVKIIVDTGISGMNNSIMLEWCKWFVEQEKIDLKNDILCFDQHRSHVNQEIIDFLENTGLKVLPFPKGSAAILSMLDNSLFKDFKLKFNNAWINKGRKLEIKESLVKEIWEEFPSKNVIGYWRKCGYSRRIKKKVISKLSKESEINQNSLKQTEMKSIAKKKRKTQSKTKDIRSFFSN